MYYKKDTRGYIKIREKVKDSDLSIQFPEFSKLIALIGIKQWSIDKKWDNCNLHESFNDYIYGLLEMLNSLV